LLSPLYRASSVDEIIRFAFNYPYTNYYQIGNSLRTDDNLNQNVQSSLDKYPIEIRNNAKSIIIYSLSPTARPLYLLTQKTFWNELIELYMEHFHPTYPLFSLQHFNPNTLPDHLLAAVRLMGYLHRGDRPDCITDYLEKYTDLIVRKCIYKVSLASLKTMYIMAEYYHFTGNVNKRKHFISCITRLSYTLGLHYPIKNNYHLNRYDADLIWSKVTLINLKFSGVSFEPSYLVNYPRFLSQLDPYYQVPHPQFNYDPKNTSIPHVIAQCITQNMVSIDIILQFYWDNIRTANHVERISQKLETRCDKGDIEFERVCLFYDDLLKKYPDHRESILPYKLRLTTYCTIMDIHYFNIDVADPIPVNLEKIDKLIKSSSLLLSIVTNYPHIGNYYTTGFLIAIGLASLKALKFSNQNQSQVILRNLEICQDWISNKSEYNDNAKLPLVILKYGIKNYLN
jgi:hypothetical protein